MCASTSRLCPRASLMRFLILRGLASGLFQSLGGCAPAMMAAPICPVIGTAHSWAGARRPAYPVKARRDTGALWTSDDS